MDKDAGVTLTNSDLTATGTSGLWHGVRSVRSRSSGKFFYQYNLDTDTTAENTIVGIGNGSASLVLLAGVNTNSVGYDPGGGFIWFNSATTAVSSSGTVNNTISIAYDLDAQLFWGRTNSGNWNNGGGADPATGAGGVSFAGIGAGPYFALATLNGGAVTANFGGASYSPAAPSGFGNQHHLADEDWGWLVGANDNSLYSWKQAM